MRRASIRIPSRRRTDRFSLTDGEQRVVELVATGLSNRATPKPQHRHAQAQRLDRHVGLVAEILPCLRVRAVRQHYPAQEMNALRLGLAGALPPTAGSPTSRGLAITRRGPPADPEGERAEAPRTLNGGRRLRAPVRGVPAREGEAGEAEAECRDPDRQRHRGGLRGGLGRAEALDRRGPRRGGTGGEREEGWTTGTLSRERLPGNVCGLWRRKNAGALVSGCHLGRPRAGREYPSPVPPRAGGLDAGHAARSPPAPRPRPCRRRPPRRAGGCGQRRADGGADRLPGSSPDRSR